MTDLEEKLRRIALRAIDFLYHRGCCSDAGDADYCESNTCSHCNLAKAAFGLSHHEERALRDAERGQ